MLVRGIHHTLVTDPETGAKSVREEDRWVEVPDVLTAQEAQEQQAAVDVAERNAGRAEHLKANDIRRCRALSDALLYGLDAELGGSTPRTRLQAIEAEQVTIRAAME